jgi:hypothetical protein
LSWISSCPFNKALLSIWVSYEWLIITRGSRLKAFRSMSCLSKENVILFRIQRWRTSIFYRVKGYFFVYELKWLTFKF